MAWPKTPANSPPLPYPTGSPLALSECPQPPHECQSRILTSAAAGPHSSRQSCPRPRTVCSGCSRTTRIPCSGTR
eukprot:357723-Chlamydomonas_euryale.AAC.3